MVLPGIKYEDVYVPPRRALLPGVPLFLGHAPAGDANVPRLLTRWADFRPAFGTPEGYLGHAVRGFFQNGGARCYVRSLGPRRTLSLAQLRSGLAAAALLEEVDLLCAPDVVAATKQGAGDNPAEGADDAVTVMQQALLEWCERSGKCFAILDPVYAHDDAGRVLAQRGALRGSYGALYHSWLTVLGPDERMIPVPPSGHLAGIYARVSAETGVHTAPANYVVEGAVDVILRPSEVVLAGLYTGSVNPIRPLTGRGIRVWGAQTLASDEEGAWRPVGVRRLFIHLRRQLAQFMDTLTFESNDVRLWVRIAREVAAYLEELYRQGALRGQTPEEAFYVKCDAETNPPAVVAAGLVVAEIGLAPTVPNEFIHLRVVHEATAGATEIET